jgi:hypothetical protein
VAWVPSTQSFPPQVAQAIETAWAATTEVPGRILFDGPLCRLESWRVENHKLHLNISRTSYKVFWGTNLSNPDIAAHHGPSALANPLGLSAALQTSDGYLLMGCRNDKVAYHPGWIHPFAGSAETADVFAGMRRELHEELALTPADISQIRCVGLAEDLKIHQPELIFHVTSPLTRSGIEHRLDRAEHDAIWAVHEKDSWEKTAATANLTPIARAVLELWSASRVSRPG